MAGTEARAVMRAGRLLEIKSGNREAVVTEQGATLAQLRWEGRPLLARPNEDEDLFASSGAYGHVLAPWPGRVTKGTYEFGGQRYHLPLDERGENAIHGSVRWLSWQTTEHVADRVALRCRLLATPGYPWPLELEQSYSWQGDDFVVAFSATNIGGQAAPFGYGCHTYFTVGPATVDDCVLHVPAASYLEVSDGAYPTGKVLPVEGTAFDFRQPRPVGKEELDVTLADLDHDEKGRAVVEFSSPTADVSIICRYEEPVKYLQLYTGDTLPAHQRGGLAVEPYTCAPNAFNNGMGLARVGPGSTFRARWTISAV